ncbi:MAG: hypothetical protein V2I46_01950 [Bacteroides sp.]|nr:hypothetical protein [Bacteroides sp.]
MKGSGVDNSLKKAGKTKKASKLSLFINPVFSEKRFYSVAVFSFSSFPLWGQTRIGKSH